MEVYMLKKVLRGFSLFIFFTYLSVQAENTPMKVTICPAITTNQKETPEAVFKAFEDMFMTRTGEWKFVQQNITQFKFYATPLGRFIREPDFLKKLMTGISDMGLGIGIETGIRHGHERCIQRTLDPITEAGGRVDFLVTDNVIVKSQFDKHKKGDYNWTYEEAVENYATFVAGIKSKYPNIKIGIIEAAFRFHWEDAEKFPCEGNPKRSWGDLKKVLLDIMAACKKKGTKLDMLQPEYSYSRIEKTKNGWEKLKAMEEFCKENDMDFIFLFNDHHGGNSSDKEFHEGVIHCLKQVQKNGLQPTIGTIQSWYKHPIEELPEDKKYTFMHLAKEFIEINGNAEPAASTDVVTEPVLMGGVKLTLYSKKNTHLRVKVVSVHSDYAVLQSTKTGKKKKVSFSILAEKSVKLLKKLAAEKIGGKSKAAAKSGGIVKLYDKSGKFMTCAIRSVHDDYVEVKSVKTGRIRKVKFSILSDESVELLKAYQ